MQPKANAPQTGGSEARGQSNAQTVRSNHSKVDFDQVNADALSAWTSILPRWLPGGKQEGPEYVARNPTRPDKKAGSFKVNTQSGKWSDFATGDGGGDLVSLVAYLDSCSQMAAANSIDRFLGTGNGCDRANSISIRRRPAHPQSKPSSNETKHPRKHPKLGNPSATWTYRDANGVPLVHQYRFDTETGKEYRPLKPGTNGWEWGAPDAPRPLYGLDRLAARPDAVVLVAEGEKAADAATQLLPDFVVVTSLNGAKSVNKADWSPLRGRRVVIWPDNDEPGAKYAIEVKQHALAAGAKSADIMDINELGDLPKGGDAHDVLVGSLSPDRLAGIVSAARRPHAVLIPVDLRAFECEPDTPHPMAIGTIVPREEVTLFGAHGGAGKSMLALIFAAHIAAGKDWGPYAVTQGRAVYLTMEDPPRTIKARLRGIIKVYDLPADAIAQNLVVLDGSRTDALSTETRIPSHAPKLIATAGLEDLRNAAVGAVLVVVDNASDAYDANENDRRFVRQFIRFLKHIAQDTGCATMLLAHVDKVAAKYGGNGNSYSGSTAWHNSSRSRLALEGADDVATLTHEKNQFGRLAKPLTLVRIDDGVLVPQFSETFGVAGAIAGINASADDAAHKSDECAVLNALRKAQAAGTTITTAKTGQMTTWQALIDCGDMPATMCKRSEKGRFRATLERLRRSGQIFSEVYTNEYRKPATRWSVPEVDPTDANAPTVAGDAE